jgi:hypothetical protein
MTHTPAPSTPTHQHIQEKQHRQQQTQKQSNHPSTHQHIPKQQHNIKKNIAPDHTSHTSKTTTKDHGNKSGQQTTTPPHPQKLYNEKHTTANKKTNKAKNNIKSKAVDNHIVP